VLKGCIQIEWMGHFEEMLAGKHPFCTELRAEFLGTERDQSAVVPLRRVRDFIEDLRAYGH
jgi:hypothetical protein